MFLTIAVCTRDRPTQLQRCLATLQPQINKQSELLVVASAPTSDAELHLAREVGARFVREVRPGLDVARNTAVRHAKGEIIAFIDDDVLVGENWLTALQAAFADETVDCVTGRVLPTGLDTPAQRHFEARFSFDRGPHPDRFTKNDQRSWFPIHPYHLGTGCNMAFQRRVFDRIGLFDEALDAGMPTGGGGDLDIFRRLLLAGFTAVYDPTLLVYHEHRPTAAATRQQFLAYGKTFTALMSKVWFEEPTLKGQVSRLCRQQAVLLLRHVWQRLTNRPDSVPLGLTFLEAAGNFLGPWAYLQARYRAKTGQQQNWPAAEVTTVDCDHKTLTDIPNPTKNDLLLVFKAGQRPLETKYLHAPGEIVSQHRLQQLSKNLELPDSSAGGSEQNEQTTPSLAVIVCTRHRPDALRACLSSLVGIRPFLTQLIVVDNSANPTQTAVIAAEFDAQFLHEPRPGLCRARNRGLAAAQAEVVAYLDDDVVVTADWLATLTAVYAQNKTVAGVMGLVLPAELETVEQQLFEQALGGLGRGFARRQFLGAAERQEAPQLGVGANMSFRRRALQKIGGFDEALDPGSPAQAGGDIDIFYRLLQAGESLIYEPAVFVWHRHQREAGAARRLSAAYGRGTAAAYAKWGMQGDWTAVRMLLGLWLRYYPQQLWTALTRSDCLTPALAWAGWRASWRGPWAYWQGRRQLRRTSAQVGQFTLKQPMAARNGGEPLGR